MIATYLPKSLYPYNVNIRRENILESKGRTRNDYSQIQRGYSQIDIREEA
jgi:hypothetical protein